MRYRFHTTDPGRAADWIRSHYSRSAVLTEVDKGFVFEHRTLEAASFAIAHVHHCGGLRMDVDPVEALLVAYLTDGHYTATCRGDSLELHPGQTCLYPTSVKCQVCWKNPTLDLVRLDRIAAAELVGGKGADIIVLDARPVSPARARGWHSLARHLAREMLPAGTMSSPLVSKSALDLIAATFTQTFPCRVLTLPRRYAVSNCPAVVHRAVEFVEANAHKSIGLADIAEAARIGPRGLQVAFRRHLDATPTEYLRRVRLDRAHRHLAAGTPQRDTVGQIAARWGWANASRFNRAYQEYYGCSPQATLQS